MQYAYAWQEQGAWFLDHMRAAGKTVIDVGCGDGWASLALKERGATVTAMDILQSTSSRLDAIHAAGIPYINGMLHGTYDIAWCHHTLEHIENPIAMLAQIRMIADELWLVVPQMDGEGFAKGHINRYNMPVLIEHLRRAGWDIEHGSYTSRPPRCVLCAVVRRFDNYRSGLDYDQDGLFWSPYPEPMAAMNTKGLNTMTPAISSWNWPPQEHAE